jgi:hypothetical protein
VQHFSFLKLVNTCLKVTTGSFASRVKEDLLLFFPLLKNQSKTVVDRVWRLAIPTLLWWVCENVKKGAWGSF